MGKSIASYSTLGQAQAFLDGVTYVDDIDVTASQPKYNPETGKYEVTVTVGDDDEEWCICSRCGHGESDHGEEDHECYNGAGYGNRCDCRRFDGPKKYKVTIDNRRGYSADLPGVYDSESDADAAGDAWLAQFYIDNNIAPEDQEDDEAGYDVHEVE